MHVRYGVYMQDVASEEAYDDDDESYYAWENDHKVALEIEPVWAKQVEVVDD